MKKFFALILSCILLLSMLPAACAAADSTTLDAYTATLDPVTNTVAIRKEPGDSYTLLDAEGTVLVSESEGYDFMRAAQGFYEVHREDQDEINFRGLIKADGSVVMPTKYGMLQVLSPRWQVGYILTPADEASYDFSRTNYSTDTTSYYKIETLDFYFDGQAAGSLDRSQCNSRCQAFGAYLCTDNDEGELAFYDGRMQRSSYEVSHMSEFDTDYSGDREVYYHQGSGQLAFDPGCSLNPEDLDQPWLVRDGKLYDIKGSEIGSFPQEYDFVDYFEGGYAVVELDGLYGLISTDGREIIPPEYEELGEGYLYSLHYGYISAVKDGMVGFLDAEGKVSCDFAYPEDEVMLYGTFALVDDGEGSYRLISAAVGELPDRYLEINAPSDYGCNAVAAVRADGAYGVVDLQGNVLLPFSSDYDRVEVSVDGSVALVETGGQYILYRF